MPEGSPIDWSDLSSETRETAIRRLVYRTKMPRVQAEDAVANAVVRLMRLRPTVRRDPTELLVVAALNEFRGDWGGTANRGHRLALAHSLDDPNHVAVVEDLADRTPDPAAQSADDDERKARNKELRAAFAHLPPMDRSVLAAYYFEGKAAIKIDEERGDPPGTAKCRIHRARQRLRGLLRLSDMTPGRSR
jgi:DNA-directed RNA polymerase specialized sigma24 family protein